MLEPASLQTPTADGELLIAPEPVRIRSLIRANQRLLRDWTHRVLGQGARGLRDRTRTAMGVPLDAPLIVSGHQPDFIHPGVWAKQAVASVLSSTVGGTAANLIVDQDVPRDRSLAVPARTARGLEVRRIPTAEVRAGTPFEAIPALLGDHLARFAHGVRQAMGASFDGSFMPLFLQAAGQCRPLEGWTGQVMAGRRAIDESLGLRVHAARVSRCWPAWHAAELILNASRFVDAYNDALAEFRRELNIRSTSRPIPDLLRDGGRVELPVWAYSAERGRRRLWIEPDATCIRLFAGADPVGRLCTADLRGVESAERSIAGNLTVQLRPRALVLTLWARLFASDLFVHGIGGAVYDRITDGIIRRFYDIEPPAYLCVSATLHMPFESRATNMNDLRQAQRRIRDLAANPQRYLDPHPRRLELEQRLRNAIESATRLRANDRENHAARRAKFQEIRQLKSELARLQPDLYSRFQERVGQIEEDLAYNRIATGREYFAGLYPREKLARLGQAVGERFG